MIELLATIAGQVEADTGFSSAANLTETGYWRRIALALEDYAGATTVGTGKTGYAKRAAIAVELSTGVSTQANATIPGYTLRIVLALEASAGTTAGNLLQRFSNAITNGGLGGARIVASNTTIPENATNGANIGTLSVINGTGTWTFTEVAPLAASLSVASNGALTTVGVLDFETAPSLIINVQATNGTDTLNAAITVTVTDIVEGGALFDIQVDDTGQSNDLGVVNPDSIPNRFLGVGNGVHPPMVTAVCTGPFPVNTANYSNTTYALEDVGYINTGQTMDIVSQAFLPTASSTTASISGPRGERKIQSDGPQTIAGGASPLYGVAEAIRLSAYAAGSEKVLIFGAANSGQLVRDQMETYDGLRWRGWRNAGKRVIRPYYASRAALGITIYRQMHRYSQIEAEITDGQNSSGTTLTPTTAYWAHYLHTSTGGTDSAITTTSLGAAPANGIISFSTTTAEMSGTIYWYVSTSASPPLAAALKLGTGAASFGNKVLFADATALNAWPADFHDNRSHRAAKFGHTAYMPLIQPIQTRITNDIGAPLEAYTRYAIESIMPQVARWRVPILDLDGNLGTFEDLVGVGPDTYRHDNTILLTHNFNAATYAPDAVHFTEPQMKALGLAQIKAVQQRTSTVQYHTLHPITRFAPVFRDVPTAGVPTGTTIPVTVRCDEEATINALCVAAGAAAPTLGAIRAGQQLAHNSVATSGRPNSQVVTATGLTPGTAYDVWLLPEDPDGYGHYGHTATKIANVSTPAAVAAQFNTTFQPADPDTVNGIDYSNDNRTVIRDASAPAGNRAFKALGEKTGGKHYSVVKVLGASASSWGLFTTALTSTGGGTADRFAILSSGQLTRPGTTNATGMGTPSAGSILIVAEDLTTDGAEMGWARGSAGVWNGSAGGDPVAGTGGVSIVATAATAVCLGGIQGATNGAGFQLLTPADTADWATIAAIATALEGAGFVLRTTA